MKLLQLIIEGDLVGENEYEVYHSSNEKFAEFESSKITNLGGDLYGEGFYFTNNYNYSRKFGKYTYRCVIRLDNPLDLTSRSTSDQLSQLTKKIVNIPKEDLRYINDSIEYKNFTSAFRKIRKYISFGELCDLFDGVIGYCEEGGKEYVVYNPNNIKVKEIKECLNENINRDKSRKVLFVDEHGKIIVYDDGDFRIAVDDENDARYITLWHKEYIKGKEYWARCGVLDAWKSTMNFKDRSGDYLSIRSIELDKKFRNMGYGAKLYKALFDFSGNDINGVFSYLPNRVNKKQVPRIYNKFGAVTDGDYQFIEFNK